MSYTQEFMSFLSQLRAATGDLSSLTAPAFLLNGISLLEYSQHWGDHPNIIWEISKHPKGSPERMLAVTRWFVSTLYGSFRQRCENQSEKKPFNPILGELFHLKWENQNSDWKSAELTVEQVSHHPPVSAFQIHLPASKVEGQPFITLEGHCGQKSSISTATITVKQEGRAKLTVHDIDGTKEIFIVHPLPQITIVGLLTMQIFLELNGTSKINSNSGTSAEINFIPAGWFARDYFGISGNVASKQGVYCTLGGKWTEVSTFTIGNETKTLFDVKNTLPSKKILKAFEEMEHNESLKLWGPCKEAIKKSDPAEASKLKAQIENHQRQIRQNRFDSGIPYVPRYFKFVAAKEDDELGTTLQDPQQLIGGQENYPGHWVFS